MIKIYPQYKQSLKPFNNIIMASTDKKKAQNTFIRIFDLWVVLLR